MHAYRHCRAMRPLLLLLVIGPSACTPIGPVPSAPSAPRPTAVLTTYTHNVYFPPGSAEIPASEAQALQAFLLGLPESSRRGVSILGHADGRAGDPQSPDLPVRRAQSVARLATLYAVEAQVAGSSESQPAVSPAGAAPWLGNRRVEVRARGYEVRLPGCPDWSRRPEGDARNLPLSNLGCANAVNLGLMVADPADLARGRDLALADGVREAEAVARYRTGKVKQLETDVLQP